MAYNKIANQVITDRTVQSLKRNGFTVEVVKDLVAAKAAVKRILPAQAEVFTATSKTLEVAGIAQLINESGRFEAVRPKLMASYQSEPDNVKARNQLTAAVDYIVGSAAAVTEAGEIMVASATGSQLAPEVYGAAHVIYVISTQKIVKDLGDGLKRITSYVFPQEDDRIQATYPGRDVHTHFSKLLVYREDFESRVRVILVQAPAGF